MTDKSYEVLLYTIRRPYNLYCVGGDVKPCSVNQSICYTLQTESGPASEVVEDILQRLYTDVVDSLRVHTASVQPVHLTVRRHVAVITPGAGLQKPLNISSDACLDLVLDAPRLAVDRLVLAVDWLVWVFFEPAATRVQPEVIARVHGQVHAAKDVGGG